MRRFARRFVLGSVLAVATLALLAPAAEAATGASVKSTVKLRSGPSTTSKAIGTLPAKARISIECRVNGQYVRGPVRRTTQWNRLTGGAYVSHGYVLTKAAIPLCPPPAVLPAAPLAATPAGPLSAAQQAQFIASSVAGAQDGHRRYGVPASVTIAQAILESSWGRSGLAANDKNFFGMKCNTGMTNVAPWAIGCRTYHTTECRPDGTCFATTGQFKVYASVANSYNDHGYLIASASRYAKALPYKNNANAFIAEVHKGGYATDPLYTDKVIKIMQQYNLYQYNVPV